MAQKDYTGTNKFSSYSRMFKDQLKDPEFKKKMQNFRKHVQDAAEGEVDGYYEGDEILPDVLFKLVKDTKSLIKNNVKNKMKEKREKAKEKKRSKEDEKEKEMSKKTAGVTPTGGVNATVPPAAQPKTAEPPKK